MCSQIISGNVNTVCRKNVVWMNTHLADRRGLHYARVEGKARNWGGIRELALQNMWRSSATC